MKKTIKYFAFFMVFMAAFVWMSKGYDVEAKGNNYTIYVDRSSNIVNVTKSNNKKQVVRSMYCSTGKNYRTPSGTYYIGAKYRWHDLYGGVTGQYCSRFSSTHILFHSVPYFSSSHNRVETKEYNKLGKQASLGCVRLAVVDCKWIYDHCKSGTKIVVGDGLHLRKPGRKLLKISTKKSSGWDPTDVDRRNPYYPKLTLKSKSCLKVKLGTEFDPKEMIRVHSAFSNRKTLLNNTKVYGRVNTNKKGKYRIGYVLIDPATQLKRKLIVTYKVIE